MTELLRNSKHEEEARRYQQLVVSSYSHVYLETMETAADKETESHKTGNTGVLCAHGGEQPKRLLEDIEYDYGQERTIKRKTAFSLKSKKLC